MIILHCVFALMFMNCVRTTNDIRDHVVGIEGDNKYSDWPSVHNAIRKRQAVQSSNMLSEGGGTVEVKTHPAMNATPPTPINTENKVPGKIDKPVSAVNQTASTTAPKSKVSANSTMDDMKPTPSALDLNKPGVVKRGAIVFGGFLVLAVAYYGLYYRKNITQAETNNSGTNDTNQFRYGVLQSDDRRENVELSQIPLTMESDDDDDEDLEIFDLGQKKKSLSYVNLQTNDEDIVFNSTSREIDTNNLLLDIEDSNGSETLINWSNNGNKSTS